MTVRERLGNVRRSFLTNATLTRDFRSSMRGWAPMWTWLGATLLLFLITLAIFVSLFLRGNFSPTDLQNRLTSFYYAMSVMLSIFVIILGPTITATGVVLEYERKSIDLLVSAPVHHGYTLVGRLLAAYRQIIMVLALALPFMATGILLGGYSPQQVLATVAGISLQGLLAAAIGLVAGAILKKTLGAIMTTFAFMGLAFVITFSYGGGALMMGFGSGSTNLPFPFILSPGIVNLAALGTTAIGSWDVPNLILAGGLMWVICHMCVLGASTAMTHGLTADIPKLRITAAVLTFFGMWAFAASMAPIFSMAFGPGGGGPPSTEVARSAGGTFFWFAMLLNLGLIPVLSTWAFIGERKDRSNGFFNIRKTFVGSPAGGLPFAVLMFLVAVAGYTLGMGLQGIPLILDYWIGLGITGALIAFYAGLGWSISASTKINALSARRTTSVLFILFMFVSYVVVSWIVGLTQNPDLMEFILVAALYVEDYAPRLFHFLLYSVLAVVLFWNAERKRIVTIKESYASDRP